MYASTCMCVCVLSHDWLLGSQWTIMHQALLSMGYPRQEYWSGLPFPPPGDLPDPGIELRSPMSPALHAACSSLSHKKRLKWSRSVVSDSLWPPWTVAQQASPSMGFSRQEYWTGLPFPSPGDLPDPGIEPRSPTLEVDALTSEPPGKS